MRFRRINKMIARLLGYFWAPCPWCGLEFGGHEVSRRRGRITAVTYEIKKGVRHESRRLVCPGCVKIYGGGA